MTLILSIFILLFVGSFAQASDEISELQFQDFRYTDDDFEQVYISASFTHWEKRALELDGDVWTVTLEIPKGRQYYRFTVVEEDDTWEAIDPANRTALNHEEYGWVSVFSGSELLSGKSIDEEKAEKRKAKQYRKAIKKELKNVPGRIPNVAYQRVDGLTLGGGLSHVRPEGSMEPSASLDGYYGFSSGRFGGRLAILQPLLPANLLNLKIDIFDRTMANSFNTGIGSVENSLAGVFLHEDYRDYHRAKGVRVGLVMKISSWLRWEAGTRFEEQSSLSRPSVWSIKDGEFISNPNIDDGSLQGVFSRLHIGKKLNNVSATYMRSGSDIFGGDFEFEKIEAQLRGRLSLGTRAGFDARLAAGTNLRGRLPNQERFLMGGLGTVRGYRYQSLLVEDASGSSDDHGGQMMALGNLEYFFRVGSDLGLVLFYDAGMAWQDRNASFTWGDLKSSTGIGLNLDSDDSFRFDLIQRLDDRKQPIVIQFRMKRVF
ncbi:MAG: BamA/TamA family outer membrane protein [bacterium]|nr:BamA/TamA family outer membrane protein [bacterium]